MNPEESNAKKPNKIVPILVGAVILIAVVIGIVQSLNCPKSKESVSQPTPSPAESLVEIDINQLKGTWERTDNDLGIIHYLTFDKSAVSYLELKSTDKSLVQKSDSGSIKLQKDEIILSLTISNKTYLESYALTSMENTLILKPANNQEAFFAGTYIKSKLPEIAEPTPTPTPIPEATAEPTPLPTPTPEPAFDETAYNTEMFTSGNWAQNYVLDSDGVMTNIYYELRDDGTFVRHSAETEYITNGGSIFDGGGRVHYYTIDGSNFTDDGAMYHISFEANDEYVKMYLTDSAGNTQTFLRVPR